MVVAVLLAWRLPRVPWGLVAYGRYLSTKEGGGKLLYLGEGMNASVAVTELSSDVRNFHISGKVEASTDAQDMRFRSMVGLLATYAGQARDLRSWLEGAPINRDRNLRLQYLAGLWLNLNQSGSIYDAMASQRRFPEKLLVGTEARRQMVRLVIERSRSSK